MKAFTAVAEKCLDTGLYVGNASPANQVRRREFLIESSRAALGFSLLSFAGCSIVKQKSSSSRDIFLESRIAEWERGIPQWLQDAKLPGASMLLIDDGKVRWQREFGVKDAVSKEPVEQRNRFRSLLQHQAGFRLCGGQALRKGRDGFGHAAHEVHVQAVSRR